MGNHHLIHLPGFEGVRGLLIGRFQNESHMEDKLLLQIIQSKPELARLPVVAKLNFGHCTPHLTFPVGGRASLRAREGEVHFMIIEH